MTPTRETGKKTGDRFEKRSLGSKHSISLLPRPELLRKAAFSAASRAAGRSGKVLRRGSTLPPVQVDVKSHI